MSKEYAEKRVMDALAIADGSAAKAKQQLMKWAQEDVTLLQALTGAHLSGIVSYHIERIQAQIVRDNLKKDAKPKHQKPTVATSQDVKKEDEEESFGLQILQAVASKSGAEFGFENNGPSNLTVPKGVKASKSHAESIRNLASKNTSKG